jgi:hypothetical protein
MVYYKMNEYSFPRRLKDPFFEGIENHLPPDGFGNVIVHSGFQAPVPVPFKDHKMTWRDDGGALQAHKDMEYSYKNRTNNEPKRTEEVWQTSMTSS